MTLLNISEEDAEEYSKSLAQIGEGWWRQVAWAFRQGIPEALGLSRREWAEIYHGYFKLPIEERREAVAELASEGMNNGQIADTLGVSDETVRRDRATDSTNVELAEEDEQKEQVVDPIAEADSTNVEPTDDEADEPLWSDDQNDVQQAESGTAMHADVTVDSEPEPLEPAEPGWHQLGEHRLYCGDSTDEEFIAACKGVFAFADPPYNAGKAEWDKGFEWEHDYLAEVAGIVAVTPGIAALKGFHTITEMPYQWSIAAEITNGMTRGALGFGNWIYVALFSNGSLYRNAKDYLRVPAHTGDDKGGNHVARKPLRLLTELIGLFTSKGDTVIDPFLGSGTTLIAAERTERRCIGAELDPMHCAEIIARYNEAVR